MLSFKQVQGFLISKIRIVFDVSTCVLWWLTLKVWTSSTRHWRLIHWCIWFRFQHIIVLIRHTVLCICFLVLELSPLMVEVVTSLDYGFVCVLLSMVGCTFYLFTSFASFLNRISIFRIIYCLSAFHRASIRFLLWLRLGQLFWIITWK